MKRCLFVYRILQYISFRFYYFLSWAHAWVIILSENPYFSWVAKFQYFFPLHSFFLLLYRMKKTLIFCCFLGGLVPPLYVPVCLDYRNSDFQNYGIIELWRNDWVISLVIVFFVMSAQISCPETTFRAPLGFVLI